MTLFIYKLLIYRRIFVFISILFAVMVFVPSFIIGMFIEDITGTRVKADFSVSSLFIGNVKFNSLTIYSSSRFNQKEAIKLTNLKVNLNLISFLRSQNVINSIQIDEIDITSIYANSSNNIADVMNNVKTYFASGKDKSSSDYQIKEVLLRNIYLKTYYYSDKAISSKLPDIYLQDINSKSGMAETVSSILGTCLVANVNNSEGQNISWWSKAFNGLANGINYSLNAAGTALNVTNDTLKTVDSVKRTVENVSNI